MPGRPSVKRKRHVSEKNDKYATSRVITCKNCFEIGHNIRSCKNPKQVLPPQETKRKGRPRTVDESERRSRKSRSSRGAKGGGIGRARGSLGNNVQEETQQMLVQEMQQTKETMEQVLETQADVDAEMVHETQSIKDLRESGYTEDEIARCVAAEHTEDDEEEGIDETQPQVTIKKRRPSERIAKLGKKIDGLGSASENPLAIE
ncbi:unnamed protein product [Lactuca virosa]|uniref:CCHC-type domain-containing protein n=1 Tax=Lactuca virosa TaxID=75947 RepID=A0AAU9LYN7_9ASTR|nr:unnamed protein product [Lactuca virosa]